MAVTDTYYYPSKENPKVIVEFKDDAYRDCSAEEINRRKQEFNDTCIKFLESIARRKNAANKQSIK